MSANAPGLLAGFETPEAFLAALRRLHADGYRRLEAFTPYPVDGADDYTPGRETPIAWIMGAAALLGGGGAFALQYWATHAYPLDVGGRPLTSWPEFIPITFELTILCAALAGVAGLFILCGLPRLHHPVFHAASFLRASQDAFFVRVRGDDPKFDERRTRALLDDAGARWLEEVPA